MYLMILTFSSNSFVENKWCLEGMYSSELIVSNAPIFVLQGVSMRVHHPIFSHVHIWLIMVIVFHT